MQQNFSIAFSHHQKNFGITGENSFFQLWEHREAEVCPDKAGICMLCHLQRPGHDSQLRHCLVWKGREGGSGQRSCQRWNPTGAAAQLLCWAHSRGWAGGSKAAFGITPSPDTHSPTGAPHSSKASGAGAAPVPLPQGGSQGCGAAAPPFSAPCSHPTASEPCVCHHGTGSLLCTRATHHLPIYLFQHNPSFQHKSALSPGFAALFVPHKAGVQGKGSPLLGSAPASSPAKLSLLALYMTQLSPQCTICIFLQGWLKISQFDLLYAKDCDI